MTVEAPTGEFRAAGPGEYVPWMDSQDQQAEFFAANPGLADVCVETADGYWTDPAEFAAAVAIMQRQAMETGDFSKLHTNADKIRGWLQPDMDDMLADVASGYPSGVNLQLVLWSVQTKNPDLRVRRPGMAARLAERFGFIGSMPIFEIAEGDAQMPVWQALRDYVQNNPAHGQHFNAGVGHIHAIAQVDLMRKVGAFKTLNVRLDDGARDAMIDLAEGFLRQARQSGEYNKLPQTVWHTIQSLIAFREDRAAYLAGNEAIARTMNRPYHALADPESQRRYNNYLAMRANARFWSNENYVRQFDWSADAVGAMLDNAVWDATDAVGTRAQVIAMERVGRYWGIVTMRRDEPEMAALINRYNDMVKDLLETYVKDGLPLLVDGMAPRWMRDITVDSWSDIDPKSSVFTEEHGSKVSDRAEAGGYLSDWVRTRVVKQKKYNEFGEGVKTVSQGYSWARKELGMVVAYRMYAEAALMVRTGRIRPNSKIFWSAEDRMQRLKYDARKEFVSMGRARLLPPDVWRAYDKLPGYHPRLLRASNTLGRVLGWTSEK